MIIIGYQGIGKSTLAGINRFIDLESGNFWVDGKREDNWYKIYCNIANHLSHQGYNVFVSSHEVVRKELANSNETVIIICPSLELEDEWIEKLKTRWEYSKLDKDYKAYMNASDRYKENILELINDNNFLTLIIDHMDYNLEDLISKYNIIAI